MAMQRSATNGKEKNPATSPDHLRRLQRRRVRTVPPGNPHDGGGDGRDKLSLAQNDARLDQSAIQLVQKPMLGLIFGHACMSLWCIWFLANLYILKAFSAKTKMWVFQRTTCRQAINGKLGQLDRINVANDRELGRAIRRHMMATDATEAGQIITCTCGKALRRMTSG